MLPELPGVGADAAPTYVAFRWTTYDVPFWARRNTRAGRWNALGDEPTQYWSLDAEAAWAELIRHESLLHESELDLVRMPMWACRVRPLPLVDLRDTTRQAEHGITHAELVGDDWRPCQLLARRLRNEGVGGIVTPCAALPTASNLTLFGARRAIDWSTRPALASTVPAAIVSLGRPPAGLLARVLQASGDPLPETLF